MPHLPLFIKDMADSALIWIESEEALQAQLSLSQDALIMDSHKAFWHWQNQQLQPMTQPPQLAELNHWIQQWASQLNQCCTTKLQVRNLSDVLEAVEYLDNF